MLQSIRDNSQGIVAKIIVGLIAVTFALFGVESLVSLTAGSNAPATVNGVEISQQDLYQGVQLQRRQMLNQMGDDADPALLDENLISNMVLEGLIEQSVLVQSAENQGLVFSDAMIDQLIVSTKDFQVDGKFERSQFEMVLRNAGLTPLSYRALVKKEKVTEQERIAYMLSAFSLKSELQTLANLDSQTRDIRYFTLDAEPVRNSVTVSDEEIADYYAENSGQFMSDEQVAIEYLLLDRDEIAKGLSVTDDDVESAYQTLVDNFQAQEQRHSAHILVEVSDEQDDAAAKAKVDAIAARLASGESFETLAQSESDDPVSAEMGGDLGVNEKGVFSAEFEDALYALEKGAVSEPVRTEFGYHLIKLVDIVESEAPAFEQAQFELREDLLNQKAEEEYVGQLERLADISFSSGDLVEPAEVLGLEIQKTELFSRSGNEDPVTSNPKILTVAFDAELIKEGLNSTPVELDSGRSVVLRIVEHQLPREKSQDEVAEQIKAILVEQKTAEQLTSTASELVASLRKGDALDSLAAGAKVESFQAVARRDNTVPQEIRTSVFQMPKPAEGASSFASVSLIDGSYAVVALDKVAAVDAELNEEELRMMSMVLNNRQGQQDYQDHTAQLKSKAEIEKL
ncbi:SurA N-terminal domain-containing protein [Neptuniibacter sp.]|uniref:SurA N-terminal domain-containing protein n=1 Tax=Neptuniibacter sp. TaxID=1962643 RepID=UPI0026217B33|nr:SurA N-terminal domain-containing protein [Neptuniibacter sp.]MCP4597346.1 peptidylprolyl isomerase [Neptuniibacter sp.]